MDKYRRVEKPKTEKEESIGETEIRVTTQGRMRNYISYAVTLFQEKNKTEVTLKVPSTRALWSSGDSFCLREGHGKSHQQNCDHRGNSQEKNRWPLPDHPH